MSKLHPFWRLLAHRYFANIIKTVNGLTCRGLNTENTATGSYYTSHNGNGNGETSVSWGVRMFKRASGGAETEITSGVPVAQIARDTNQTTPAEQTATYVFPATMLALTDSLVVRVYAQFGTATWFLLVEFTTPQLTRSSLPATKLTVYYWTERVYQAVFDRTAQAFYYGEAAYNSRIVGFRGE